MSLELVLCFMSFLGEGAVGLTALVSRSSSLGSSQGRGHCVVFLGKTLYSHSASLHPGVQMGTGGLNTGG